MADASNIAFLPGVPAPMAREPDHRLIDMLRCLLDEARAGELQGLAIAAVNGSGGVKAAWEGGNSGVNDMTAAIARLQYLFVKAAVEQDCTCG